MTWLRLHCDEDSGRHAVVSAMRRRGFDVTTTPEAQLAGASDEEQLEHAAREHRTLYSANTRDFARIHQSWLEVGRSHWGIIVRTRQQLDVGNQVRLLTAIDTSMTSGQIRDQLLYLDAFSVRE